MGMFGALKRKPMFGEIPGMGQMQPPMGQPQPQVGAMDPNTQAMTKKPGFFAQGQPGRQIIGVIGDTLATLGGGQGVYMPAMLQQQQQDAEIRARLQEAIAKRKAEREDYTWKSEYDRANPKSINNDTANDYAFWKSKLDAKEITPEQFNDRVFPARYVIDNATGQQIRIGGIEYTPATAGVTFTPLEEGGPVQQAPDNFPYR